MPTLPSLRSLNLSTNFLKDPSLSLLLSSSYLTDSCTTLETLDLSDNLLVEESLALSLLQMIDFDPSLLKYIDRTNLNTGIKELRVSKNEWSGEIKRRMREAGYRR